MNYQVNEEFIRDLSFLFTKELSRNDVSMSGAICSHERLVAYQEVFKLLDSYKLVDNRFSSLVHYLATRSIDYSNIV